jgi:hypothetical protein
MQFLAFMCPGHRAKGLHPPTGSDLSICPRQILGTYDGHDYGWYYTMYHFFYYSFLSMAHHNCLMAGK